MIKLTTSSFITSKKGETAADCQDAKEQNEDIDRYAVADGATLSLFPKKWAELLVKYFCEPNPRGPSLALEEENWEEWIEPIQQEWLQWVSETVQETKTYILVDRLSRRESALSTFIGLEFDVNEGKWRALIQGDSCLFHQSGAEFKSYLLEKLEDFQYRPKSFASFPKDNPVGGDPDFIPDNTSKANPGDLFILATDALAKWIVQQNAAGNLDEALNRLKQIETQEQFDKFVNLARDCEDIRLVNDDVTLMLISVEEVKPESLEVPTSEEVQPLSGVSRVLLILAGVFGFVGFIILVLILINKK